MIFELRRVGVFVPTAWFPLCLSRPCSLQPTLCSFLSPRLTSDLVLLVHPTVLFFFILVSLPQFAAMFRPHHGTSTSASRQPRFVSTFEGTVEQRRPCTLPPTVRDWESHGPPRGYSRRPADPVQQIRWRRLKKSWRNAHAALHTPSSPLLLL